MEEKQELVIAGLSLVLDNPFVRQLKTFPTARAIGEGAYDVGEAWAYILILDRSTKDLMTITDAQLETEKSLTKRMKCLVTEHAAAKEQLARRR